MFATSGNLTLDFFVRFLVNGLFLFVLLRLIHYRTTLQRGSLGGFMLFGNGIFVVTALLHDVELSMGFAFGLFAVFSMLRYRTESLSTVEMAYLFVAIAVSLLSAVGNLNLLELMLVNGLICALAMFCESSWLATRTVVKNIVYEKIELIRPERIDELRADLRQRTGLTVDRVEVGDVDFLKDTAVLKVYYAPDGSRPAAGKLPAVAKSDFSSMAVKEGEP